MRFALLSLALLVPALGQISCTATRTVPVRLRVEHTQVEPAPAPSDRLLVITVDGRSVSRLPRGVGRPLASSARLITGPSNEPLAASASPAERVLLITSGATLPPEGSSPQFGSVDVLPARRVLVPAACIASLGIEPAAAAATTPGPPALVELLIRATDPPSLTLRAERDQSEEESALEAPRTAADRPVQSLRVDWPLDQTEGEFLLAVPAAPDRGIAQATLWRLNVRQADPDDPAVEEARPLIESARSAATPAMAATPWRSMARSLRRTSEPGPAREALAFAAVDAGADLTAEVAAVADDRDVPALASVAAAALEQSAPDAGRAAIGWTIDRATILALAKMHASSACPRALAAVLSARFGEVGRDPPALADVATRSSSATEMERRLQAEHLILLDDASPALRVRAYDWLASRGAAPTGYDPLGAPRERRAAVDRYLQAAEAKP